MRGLAILAGFHLAGVGIQHGLHIPLPGNVIGLVLFTLALFAKIIKLEWVEESAQFLLKHMLLLFAPIVVGVVAVLPLLEGQAASVIGSLFVSTFISLAVTGWVTHSLTKPKEDRR